MPPKRKGANKAGDKGKTKQPKQDGQKAVSHDIDIPLDEGFKEDGEFIEAWPMLGHERYRLTDEVKVTQRYTLTRMGSFSMLH